MPIETAAHLLAYDSVHGPLENVLTQGDNIIVNDQAIAYSQIKDPSQLQWGVHNIDVVVECSGTKKSFEDAAFHLQQGAQRVLVSSPCSGNGKTVVFGVNHQDITPFDKVISNASCTTNALAPIFAALNNILFKNAFVTTTHAYTSDQKLVDGPHSDLRRARSAATSIIPTSTGAAKTLAKILPNLTGKIDGLALRVPCDNVSLVDITLNTHNTTSAQQINDCLESASLESFNHVLGFTNKPLVSKDFIGCSKSVTVDGLLTQVIDSDLIKIFGWYDNEWGFACRLCDVTEIL